MNVDHRVEYDEKREWLSSFVEIENTVIGDKQP